MNDKNALQPSLGTTLKLLVSADLGEGIHLEDVDFCCVFFRYGINTGQTVNKSEMSKISQDEYIAVVDTKIIGTGEYYMRLTAYIPDTDVDSGIRTEVVVVPTGIRVTN